MQDIKSKEQSLNSGPSVLDEFKANQTRTAPIYPNSESSIQYFRGLIPSKSTVVLQTNGKILNLININILKTGYSELTIYPFDRKDHVPGAVPPEALPEKEETEFDKKRPYKGAAKKALDVVAKADRIRAIATAPMDQTLLMEVFFGDGHWRENYVSGQLWYKYRVKGAAETAMIKLTAGSPINAAWFSFETHIRMFAEGEG